MQQRDDILVPVTGIFYRAIAPEHRDSVLLGSHTPGRYSRDDQPTLYLSSSPEGAAVMIAHKKAQSQPYETVKLRVNATNIFDLRDPFACQVADIELYEANEPWQALVERGRIPSSWRVRYRLELMGAQGLIDPSRTLPDSWHLVLFDWNREGAAQVSINS